MTNRTPLPEALAAEALVVSIDPTRLGFKTTDDIAVLDGSSSQDRALQAIRFGTDIRAAGFNLFLLGTEGTGRHALIKSFLKEKAASMADACDWVYTENFETSHQPTRIQLPAGRGRLFARAMDGFIEDVRTSVPAFINNEENQNRLRSIEEEAKQKPEQAMRAIREKAEADGIALLRTPFGFAFAPQDGEEIIKPEAFEKLPEEKRQAYEAKISVLQKELQAVLEQIPRWEKQGREALHAAIAEMMEIVIKASIKSVIGPFGDIPEVLRFLDQVRLDMIENFNSAAAPSHENKPHGAHANGGDDGTVWLDRYKVNALVTQEPGTGVPVVHETNPTLSNLVGRVEHLSEFGALVTNFTLIKAGALHRANGGYIILDAEKLLQQPFSWDALKRALTGKCIKIESPGQMLSLVSTITLEPEPIPLDVKVVLIGSRRLYYLLSIYDPEFLDLFKVEVDFDQDVNRSAETEHLFTNMIAGLVRSKGLLKFDSKAVALVMQRAIRMAGDQKKISVHTRQISDLMEEANYHAHKENAEPVSRAHVQRAVDAQVARADRIREQSYEMITRNMVLLKTDGSAIGQINGLSVLQLGGFAFGRPTRISARVRLGTGKVVDIEREVELGGPLHSKGVLILSAFLSARYAVNKPLSLAASLVFEQSYGGVDGDSASSAELYALLSAISEVPLRQDLAVTGSVNQYGEVQVIGGVNEKIEGFFDICQRRGLTGTQGVLIPAGNAEHLMLEERVVQAVRDGTFHVYPVHTIDEGISLLTGRDAGVQTAKGNYPATSINNLVEKRLTKFARAGRHLRSRDSA